MHHEVQRTMDRGSAALTDDFSSVDSITPVTQRSMFWKPLYLNQSDCLEHLPFLFWLVEAIRPRAILEVGNGDAVAYFALCQAVERLGLDASCTLMCPEGAANGSTQDFEKVELHNDTHYAGFSVLMRGDVAGSGLTRLPNQSVDLLLIHGADAFMQVNGNFDRWLHKLAPNAVILLAGGAGVEAQDELTERVKRDYHHFEFVHGQGLLVACRGAEPVALLERIFTASHVSSERQAFRQVFSRLGRSCLDAWTARQASHREKKWAAAAQSAQQDLQQSQARAQQVLEELQLRGHDLTEALSASDQNQRAAYEAAQQLRAKSLEVQNVRQELLLSRQENERLTQHTAALQIELEEHKANAAESEAQQRRASQSMQAQHAVQLAQQVETHQRELSQMRAELEAAQAARLQSEYAFDQFRAEVLQRAEQQRQEWQQAQSAQQSLHAAETERMREQFEQAQAQAQVRQEAELDRLTDQLNSRCAELTQLSHKLDETNRSAEVLTADLAALRSQNEQLQYAQVEVAVLTQRLTDSYAQMAGVTKQLEEREEQLTQAQSQVMSARETVAAHEDELARLRASVEQLHAQVQQAQDKLTDRYREISQLTMAVEERDRILALREQDLEASKNRLTELKDTVSWQLTAPVRALAKPFIQGEKKKRTLMTQIALIEKSGMFDVTWYQTSYPEVKALHVSPIEHYLTIGAAEGKDPGPSFDTKWYLAHNDDVARSGVNPLVHYLKFGRIEGRSARPVAQ